MAAASSDGDVPLLSPGAMWNIRRALLSGLATAGLWRLAVIEVQSMHGRERTDAAAGGSGDGNRAEEAEDSFGGALTSQGLDEGRIGGADGWEMVVTSVHWQVR